MGDRDCRQTAVDDVNEDIGISAPREEDMNEVVARILDGRFKMKRQVEKIIEV